MDSSDHYMFNLIDEIMDYHKVYKDYHDYYDSSMEKQALALLETLINFGIQHPLGLIYVDDNLPDNFYQMIQEMNLYPKIHIPLEILTLSEFPVQEFEILMTFRVDMTDFVLQYLTSEQDEYGSDSEIRITLEVIKTIFANNAFDPNTVVAKDVDGYYTTDEDMWINGVQSVANIMLSRSLEEFKIAFAAGGKFPVIEFTLQSHSFKRLFTSPTIYQTISTGIHIELIIFLMERNDKLSFAQLFKDWESYQQSRHLYQFEVNPLSLVLEKISDRKFRWFVDFVEFMMLDINSENKKDYEEFMSLGEYLNNLLNNDIITKRLYNLLSAKNKNLIQLRYPISQINTRQQRFANVLFKYAFDELINSASSAENFDIAMSNLRTFFYLQEQHVKKYLVDVYNFPELNKRGSLTNSTTVIANKNHLISYIARYCNDHLSTGKIEQLIETEIITDLIVIDLRCLMSYDKCITEIVDHISEIPTHIVNLRRDIYLEEPLADNYLLSAVLVAEKLTEDINAISDMEIDITEVMVQLNIVNEKYRDYNSMYIPAYSLGILGLNVCQKNTDIVLNQPYMDDAVMQILLNPKHGNSEYNNDLRVVLSEFSPAYLNELVNSEYANIHFKKIADALPGTRSYIVNYIQAIIDGPFENDHGFNLADYHYNDLVAVAMVIGITNGDVALSETAADPLKLYTGGNEKERGQLIDAINRRINSLEETHSV